MTQEACTDASRAVRGGDIGDSGSSCPVKYKYSGAPSGTGFGGITTSRPMLYVL